MFTRSLDDSMKTIHCFAVGITALLLLCCTGCGGQPEAAATGLLSLEEIEELENSYGLSKEELLKKLSLTDADVERWEEKLGLLEFSGQRVMGSLSFTPTCNFAVYGDLPGLYAIRFTSVFELDQKETVRDAFDALSQEAVELYGENYQGPVGSNLEEASITRWKIGDQSSVALEYAVRPDEWENILVSVTYRLVIPGSIQDFG